MRVSYQWLKSYLEPLPPPERLSELLTFHAYQVESVEKAGDDFIFDVDVLPNRSHDSLSHMGIARELGRLLGKPPRGAPRKDYAVRSQKKAVIEVKEPALCPRYMAVVVENVEVGESPAWLKERLEAVGQRSVNNIVDITNFIMLETGQPLHAFDLDKLGADSEGNPHIIVRKAEKGEELALLDDVSYRLSGGELVIANPQKILALAGVKGGKDSGISKSTRHVVIESANFNSISIRKTARGYGLRTDASIRFEQGITPELAEEGMRRAVELVLESCKEAQAGPMSDAYPKKRQPYTFGVSVSEVNKLLGTELSEKEVEDVLNRLDFKYEKVSPLEHLLELAPKFEGVPYKYGASISYDAPEAFDCSSFTAYLYAQAGIGLPRMVVDQYAYGTPVKEKELAPGDLVFSNTGSGKVYHESIEFLPGQVKIPAGVDHVGLYLGKGNVIHATRVTGEVTVEPLASSAQFRNIVGYRRIPEAKELRFVATAPPERLDLMATRAFLVSGIKEDLIEEIGRVYDYRNIKAANIPKAQAAPVDDENFIKANKIRAALVAEGYSEVMTYVFRERGAIELKNPLSSDKKFLRGSLKDGLVEALELNIRNAPLLGLARVKLFEIGVVFGKDKEEVRVGIAEEKKIEEYSLDEAYEKFGKRAPEKPIAASKEVKYKPTSPYPFVLRDIAVFVPKGVESETVLSAIERESGPLLVQKRLFDTFEKEGKISYAFNLVFQSHEKTLSDAEVNEIMGRITKKLNSKEGWRVR